MDDRAMSRDDPERTARAVGVMNGPYGLRRDECVCKLSARGETHRELISQTPAGVIIAIRQLRIPVVRHQRAAPLTGGFIEG